MKPKRNLLAVVTFLVTLGALIATDKILEHRNAVAQAAGVQAPMFEVDPLWPKPLSNHWILGNTVTIASSFTMQIPENTRGIGEPMCKGFCTKE